MIAHRSGPRAEPSDSPRGTVAPSALTPSRDPSRPPRRRSRAHPLGAMMLAAVLVAAGALTVIRLGAADAPPAPLRLPPFLVAATLRLDGALVQGASARWAAHRATPVPFGDPVAVSLTAYCLRGRTRRDGFVREGIVAADPRMFPLARYLELYVGSRYWGRFLIDDTGGAIKGNRIDIWTPTCREARRFGRQRGIAVLVPRPRGAHPDTLMTGRLGGARLASASRGTPNR